MTNQQQQQPSPPNYAVIFVAKKRSSNEAYLTSYNELAKTLREKAERHAGFVYFESVEDVSGWEITISYWKDEESIRQWKSDLTHLLAQEQGRVNFYSEYHVRVAKLQRSYSFRNNEGKL
jgi:heme-degrading monooxygenase HmoA